MDDTDPSAERDPLRPARRDIDAGPRGMYFDFVPYEQRWSGPEDGPVPRKPDGLPRLTQIVPERWADVLSVLTRAERSRVPHQLLMHPREAEDLYELLRAMPPPPDELARAAMAADLPQTVPELVDTRRTSRVRQVNVRIGRPDFELLEAAAHIVGTTPTTLSRMLILGGMRKVLADHGKHYGPPD